MNTDRFFTFRAEARIAADQEAVRLLFPEENGLIHRFHEVYENILEANRTRGTTNRDRKKFEQRAFDLVPGSREAYGKWERALDEGARARMFRYN